MIVWVFKISWFLPRFFVEKCCLYQQFQLVFYPSIHDGWCCLLIYLDLFLLTLLCFLLTLYLLWFSFLIFCTQYWLSYFASFLKNILLYFFYYHLSPYTPRNHHTVLHVDESSFLFAWSLYSLTPNSCHPALYVCLYFAY